MPRLIHPLLLLVARATERDLVPYIEYLKTEDRILRSKLPKRIDVTPAERAKLVKLGVRLGSAIKELITIVHPRTFARWLSEGASKAKRRKPGRQESLCYRCTSCSPCSEVATPIFDSFRKP